MKLICGEILIVRLKNYWFHSEVENLECFYGILFATSGNDVAEEEKERDVNISN